jgi:RNA polymerase sigma-70 factor, ECF subfamily
MVALAIRLVGGTDSNEDASTTDASLLAAASRRDQGAFARLVNRHYQTVYRVVWRMVNGHADAEDLTQEAFLRLWQNPQQLREAGALRGWLIRVATNLAADRFKAAKTVDLEHAGEVGDGQPDATRLMQRTEVRGRIDAAIANLPERQRLALTLVQFEQMSNIAAAEIMDLTVDALESLLARARRGIKQQLSGEWKDMIAALAEEG